MPNLAMLSLMILLPLSALSPLSAKASRGLPVENMPPQDYYFDVLLDGKPIGEHRFQFEPVENGYQLQSRADYLVKVLLIPFYEYSHASDELWREGCVRHIQSTTDDNGKDYHVQGQQVEGEQEQAENAGGNFILAVNRETRSVSQPCVRTFAYWNPRLLDKSALLNSQTGELDPVTFASAGRTPLPWSADQQATTYKLDTPKGEIRLWYGDEGSWLGLESRLKGGRTLLYQPPDVDGGQP